MGCQSCKESDTLDTMHTWETVRLRVFGGRYSGKTTLLKALSYLSIDHNLRRAHDRSLESDRKAGFIALCDSMLITFQMNEELIESSESHRQRMEDIREPLRLISKMMAKNMGERDEQSMLDAMVTICKEWTDFEQLWNQHWENYHLCHEYLWWYRRLTDPHIQAFLIRDGPEQAKDGIDLYLRCYHPLRSGAASVNIRDHSWIIRKQNNIPIVLNYWVRHECGLPDGHLYRELSAVIAEFSGKIRKYQEYIFEKCPNRNYVWSMTYRDISGDSIEYNDIFIYTASLTSFLRVGMDLSGRVQNVSGLCKDQDLFARLVNGRMKCSESDEYCERSSHSKCVLVLTHQDSLREVIRDGYIDMNERIPDDYTGPLFSDEDRKGNSESEWLDICVSHLTDHLISGYLAIPGASDFVVKTIVLSPTDLDQVAEKLLSREFFSRVDQVWREGESKYW